MDPSPDPAATPPRKWVNWRIVLLLVTLLALICAAVILTDHFSPRNKSPHAPTISGGPLS